MKSPTTIDLREWCTAEEYAQVHGVSRALVHRWAGEGRIASVMVAGRRLVLRDQPRPEPKPGHRFQPGWREKQRINRR